MDVKIKKEGEVKKFKLIKKWSDVSLEKWVKLVNFHTGSKSSEALNTIAELSNIPDKLIKELALRDVVAIMSQIAKLQAKQNSSLASVVEIDEIRYGFHPDLDSITLGEYADIETFIKDGVEKNMPELMAILYRPIKEEKNDVYTIDAYDGNIRIRAEQMKKMSAEQVQSALLFFYNFGNVFLVSMQLYLIGQQKETKQQ